MATKAKFQIELIDQSLELQTSTELFERLVFARSQSSIVSIIDAIWPNRFRVIPGWIAKTDQIGRVGRLCWSGVYQKVCYRGGRMSQDNSGELAMKICIVEGSLSVGQHLGDDRFQVEKAGKIVEARGWSFSGF